MFYNRQMDASADSHIFNTTVDSDGHVSIPPEVLKSLGISPGSRLIMRVEEGSLVIQSPAKLLASLRGSLAGGPSLEDELYESRRTDKW